MAKRTYTAKSTDSIFESRIELYGKTRHAGAERACMTGVKEDELYILKKNIGETGNLCESEVKITKTLSAQYDTLLCTLLPESFKHNKGSVD